jgi:hypothetical protein
MNKWWLIRLFNSVKEFTSIALNYITKLDPKGEMRCTSRWASFPIQIIIQNEPLIAISVHEIFQIFTAWMHAISMDASKNTFKRFLCTSHWLRNYTFWLIILLRLHRLITFILISFVFNLSYKTRFFLHHTF